MNIYIYIYIYSDTQIDIWFCAIISTHFGSWFCGSLPCCAATRVTHGTSPSATSRAHDKGSWNTATHKSRLSSPQLPPRPPPRPPDINSAPERVFPGFLRCIFGLNSVIKKSFGCRSIDSLLVSVVTVHAIQRHCRESAVFMYRCLLGICRSLLTPYPVYSHGL